MNRDEAEEYTQAAEQTMGGGWRFLQLGDQLGVPQALGLSLREWGDRIGGYVRLSVPERREAVTELTEQGKSTREIGELLGVHHSTVADDQHVGNPTRDAKSESNLEPELSEIRHEPEPEEDFSAQVDAAFDSSKSRWEQRPSLTPHELLGRLMKSRDAIHEFVKEYDRAGRPELKDNALEMMLMAFDEIEAAETLARSIVMHRNEDLSPELLAQWGEGKES